MPCSAQPNNSKIMFDQSQHFRCYSPGKTREYYMILNIYEERGLGEVEAFPSPIHATGVLFSSCQHK